MLRQLKDKKDKIVIMKRYNLINLLIENFNYQRYLEIGLDTGHNFNQIKCENKESVDPAKDAYQHAKPTYVMTSDKFFTERAPHLDKWDIIFIDGLHHADQVDRDIENALKFLTPNGSIVLHDCNPLTELAQRVPRESREWNGDVWKSIAKFRSTSTTHGCIVINSDHGLGWIHSTLPLAEPFNPEYTYTALQQHRTQYLGLVEVENFNL